MSVTLVTIRTSTRGKNPRIVEYQGIGNVTPFEKLESGAKSDSVDVSGVVTTVKDAVELSEGNLQKMLDRFSLGYNFEAREAALDIDDFGTMLDDINWSKVAESAKAESNEKTGRTAIENVQAQFKRTARAFSNQAGLELEKAVELLKAAYPKVEKAA